MKKHIVIITLMSYLVSMSGCMTTNQSGAPDAGSSAASGGAWGALLGAATGYLATGKVGGAVKGAAAGFIVGTLTGYIVGERREREYKSARQIYMENPILAKPSSANIPPRITEIVPTIKSVNDQPLRVIKGGQKVRLGTKYQIEIPKYSDVTVVDVVEINTLTDPDGLKMSEKDLSRSMRRSCGGVDADIMVTLPKNAKEGIYIHDAVVKLGGKRYSAQKKIQMVKVDGVMQFYALN